MSHTIHYILFPHRSHRLHHERLVGVLPQPGQLLGPHCLEVVLNLREDQLDRIELWSIRNVKDPTKTELSHGRLGLIRSVNCELVHEDADQLVAGPLL